jgi:hypothetical protein
MALVNHLKNQDAQRKTLAIAAGRHDVEGHLIYSYVVGTDPDYNIFIRQALGEGIWEGPEGLWYLGLNVPATDYRFWDGSQVESTDFFDTDVPHFRTAGIDVMCPTGVGEFDTEASAPDGLRGIFKTEKFPDFNASGYQIDFDGNPLDLPDNVLDRAYFSYTANPARIIVGWLFKYGKISRSRINWPVWCDWRDYTVGAETVDYTTIAAFDGFGLRGKFYAGSNFDEFITERIDPVLEFPSSAGAPAVGLPVDSFSVEWTGSIKALFDEEYTFTIEHDNGAYLQIDKTTLIDEFAGDGSTSPGSHTGSIALSAGEYYDITVRWNEGGSGPADFRLSWSSESQDFEVIPPEVLYPTAEERPRYEAHVAFSDPTDLDSMIDTILFMSNSIKQDVDGKIEFYCVEQMSPSFEFLESHVIDGSFRISRSDLRNTQAQNVFEAKFKDLDSQYLEEPLTPIQIEADDLIEAAGRKIYGQPIDMQNMTRWQARKVLLHLVNISVVKDLIVEFNGRAQTYPVIARDRVTLTHPAGDFSGKEFEVIEATDNSPEETADTRVFKLQEW